MIRFNLQADQLGAFVSGALDVIFAFSIALERKGLLERRELVNVLQAVQAQIGEQEQDQPGRKLVVDVMLQAFALPVAGDQVRARWQVIDGGDGTAAPLGPGRPA